MLQHPCLPCFCLLFLLFPAKYSLNSCNRRTLMSLLANLVSEFTPPYPQFSPHQFILEVFLAFLSGLCLRFDVSYKVFYARIFLLSFSNVGVFLIFFWSLAKHLSGYHTIKVSFFVDLVRAM